MKNSKKGYTDLLLLLNMLDCGNNNLFYRSLDRSGQWQIENEKAEIAKLKTQCYSKCDLSW